MLTKKVSDFNATIAANPALHLFRYNKNYGFVTFHLSYAPDGLPHVKRSFWAKTKRDSIAGCSRLPDTFSTT